MKRLCGAAAVFATSALATASARAGSFDAQGNYVVDPAAVAFLDFTSPVERYLPDNVEMQCKPPAYQLKDADDALEGKGLLRVAVPSGCVERILVDLPAEQGSYKATVWMRHGSVNAQMRVSYPDGSGLPPLEARMFPTGRSTSDGWVELASNELSVDGTADPLVYFRILDFADMDGVELDALELVPAGDFAMPPACAGHGDPICGPEGMCANQLCRYGRLGVPTLPEGELKGQIVDRLEEKLTTFYGGKLSRAEYLPLALQTLEGMRSATTAWQYWGAWALAIRQLHDWHTRASVPIDDGNLQHRLTACFIEGDADASHDVWPKDPAYADVLVSHVGGDAMGLHAGDRLLAVDGMHPLAWARSLVDENLGYHIATDPAVFADYAEDLGGGGGAIIPKFAHSFTVLRCDQATGTCATVPETILVTDLPAQAQGVSCDNRPFYHFDSGNPPANHQVFFDFYRGRIEGTTEAEAIFGMVWDTLYGGGDPNGWVNSNISNAITDWKATARGVILDHRAGNGGTLDAAENVTKLVRPPETVAIIRMPMEIAGYDGPATIGEGISTFLKFKASDGFDVGAVDHDPLMPVALIIHRDGSASDYMPFGMKGAPKVRIFGPHQTVGAFSTFIDYTWWGGLGQTVASGDTLASTGMPLIGHGVEPDVVLLPKQSDLLAGKDTLHEAALAWVRQELKP